MKTISDTIERLSRYRSNPSGRASQPSELKKREDRGRNPGQLTGWYKTPKDPENHPALVVVLHGCTQTAAGYDHGSGWSRLADDYGFAVLFPEQSRQNNANLCFNWFQADDVTRDRGDVLSIREMVDGMITECGIDPKRVYVTGLSAGGAMANALLATYPDVFAGGAIIAGLPFGAASTVPEAFDRMRGHGLPSPTALDNAVRTASQHKGPWPTVSIWHGTTDTTVVEANARAIIEQWCGVHGVGARANTTQVVDGQALETWKDASGRDVIEHYRISGMGHGTPLDTRTGYGHSAPYMLDVGISSTVHIARSWGLTPSFERRAALDSSDAAHSSSAEQSRPVGQGGIQDVIERALRSAGLMK
ncbi:extracellular catalytic domain type 1 short-chain-length polyhydroxyalkanoate depolymerase [Pararhizobium sp. PWRC1-1]|uniref:extracellular catalytic domain type 1 short-chain-length polyhydroxyalkanoate depolymerase n=1 Tax=Pararhizobium sp. PWRC1-1 TaxID=2804566 RepID=UPI003CF47396